MVGVSGGGQDPKGSGCVAAVRRVSLMGIFSAVLTTLSKDFQSAALQLTNQTKMQFVSTLACFSVGFCHDRRVERNSARTSFQVHTQGGAVEWTS